MCAVLTEWCSAAVAPGALFFGRPGFRFGWLPAAPPPFATAVVSDFLGRPLFRLSPVDGSMEGVLWRFGLRFLRDSSDASSESS